MFSLLLSLGALIGLSWVALRAPAKNMMNLFDAGLWSLGGALVGGRLAHVAAGWLYYQDLLLDIPQIWLGGMSGPGALTGALFTLAILAAFTRRPLGATAAGLLPLALSLSVAAWLGSWLVGSAYGPPGSSWWAIPSADEWGAVEPRFPLQLAAAVITLVSFLLLDVAVQPGATTSPRARGFLSPHLTISPGQHAALGLLVLGLEIYAVSLLRFDPGQSWQGQRLETWAGLAFILFSMAAVLVNLVASWRHSIVKGSLRRSTL